MKINSKFLEKMGVRHDRAEKYGPSFEKALVKYGIITVLQKTHFVSQVLHESGMLKFVEENLNYSAEALRAVFGKYFPTAELAKDYSRQPERIANRVYANRMGNGSEESGDGYHFRGRGFIQLTGRNNYKQFSDWIDTDVVDAPHRVAEEFPLESAIFYWVTNGLGVYADLDNYKRVTKLINGGDNGLTDRYNQLVKAKAIIALPDEDEDDRYAVTVLSLNYRTLPIISPDNIIGQLNQNDIVSRLTEPDNAGWVLVKLSSGKQGYVAQRYLRKI